MLANPYCGDSMPLSRTSSSNHLFFHFQSDYLLTGTGFKLEYNATGKNPYNSDSWSLDSRAKKKNIQIDFFKAIPLPKNTF